MTEGDRLVGIVARGDVMRLDDAGDDEPLLDHATRQVVTVSTTDTAQSALRIMVDEHVEHVPVVDHDHGLVGICTRTDLLKVRRRQLELNAARKGQPPTTSRCDGSNDERIQLMIQSCSATSLPTR